VAQRQGLLVTRWTTHNVDRSRGWLAWSGQAENSAFAESTGSAIDRLRAGGSAVMDSSSPMLSIAHKAHADQGLRPRILFRLFMRHTQSLFE
jgi:hypothetical protein